MTAVHDTLRQAIADEIAAWGTRGNEYRPLADAVLAVVMADPTVARWKNIAAEVDRRVWHNYPEGSGVPELLTKLRAAGKTT